MALAMASKPYPLPKPAFSALDAAFGAQEQTSALPALALGSVAKKLDTLAPAATAPGLPLIFDINWEGVAFVARIESDANSKDALITLTCRVGWLPYTAENHILRAHALKCFRQHTTELTGKFTISITGQVSFIQKTRTPGIGSRTDIIQALTICLLQARSYLKMAQGLLQPS